MKDHETVGDNRIIQKKKRSTPISENYISIQIIISEYQLKISEFLQIINSYFKPFNLGLYRYRIWLLKITNFVRHDDQN